MTDVFAVLIYVGGYFYCREVGYSIFDAIVWPADLGRHLAKLGNASKGR